MMMVCETWLSLPREHTSRGDEVCAEQPARRSDWRGGGQDDQHRGQEQGREDQVPDLYLFLKIGPYHTFLFPSLKPHR